MNPVRVLQIFKKPLLDNVGFIGIIGLSYYN